MGRINGIDQEDTPPNVIVETPSPLPTPTRRTDSPVIAPNPVNLDEAEDGQQVDSVQTVPCSVCNRHFSVDRIQTHAAICSNTKERKVYDVAKMRVQGTEAEELVKNGRLKLEPAKPLEKKSVLNQKLGQPAKEPLPPIAKNNKPSPEKKSNNGQTVSYQVVFDDADNMKTKKHSKFSSLSMRNAKLPAQKIDERYLSALNAKNRWLTAAQKISPGIADHLDDGDADFLAASMTSQKTVCSDAFDFLFDSQNLNPQKLEDLVENHQPLHGEEKKKQKGCCVIC